MKSRKNPGTDRPRDCYGRFTSVKPVHRRKGMGKPLAPPQPIQRLHAEIAKFMSDAGV